MMISRTTCLLAAACALAFLSGCASREIKVREGTLPPTTETGDAPSVRTYTRAEIVHVDRVERLVTIENEELSEDDDFVLSFNQSGEQTGVLQLQGETPSGHLRAEICEGRPSINDRIALPDDTELAELREKFRDPLAEGE